MTKKITLLFCLIPILLLFNIETSARGYSVECSFSKCTVECPAPRAYACGCYFGIATCACEAGSGSSSTTRIYDSPNISSFIAYASAYLISNDGGATCEQSPTMANLAAVLADFNDGQTNIEFSTTFTAYELAVDALTEQEKEDFIVWIAANPSTL